MTGGLWLVLTGHSPYRQWEVYRKVRLIVVVNAEDEASVRLGQAIAGLLAKHLPDSRAMMSRARDLNDLVRLVATKQLDAALMREEDAGQRCEEPVGLPITAKSRSARSRSSLRTLRLPR